MEAEGYVGEQGAERLQYGCDPVGIAAPALGRTCIFQCLDGGSSGQTPILDEESRVRVKTEDRRQAIIEVAMELFREVGYERASMALISRRLGGSKGTLYGYFESKEELFEAAMRTAVEGPGDQIMGLLDPEIDDLRKVLTTFARAYLDFILGEEVLSITRTAVADGAGLPLGTHLFDQGPGRAITLFLKFFEEQIKRGRLRAGRPVILSLHFKSLIESGFLEEALYGTRFRLKRQEAAKAAVDAFLRAYASEPTLPAQPESSVGRSPARAPREGGVKATKRIAS